MRNDTLRSEAVELKYAEHKKRQGNKYNMFNFPKVKEYKFWIIVENEFPYDKVAEVHHLLIPKRKFANESEMKNEEYEELMAIKKEVSDLGVYSSISENLHKERTILDHYHLHLIKYKKGNS